MLDERTRQMLEVANSLNADDLDRIRASAPAKEDRSTEQVVTHDSIAPPPVKTESPESVRSVPRTTNGGVSQGERERKRTRESKVSTVCVGEERPKHTWWPVGTELIGRIGSDTFNAQVVENPQVKSGRSLLITSGAAQGRVCMTPTRAALEATEAYRNRCNLGRSGGVTNGWTFWQPTPT